MVKDLVLSRTVAAAIGAPAGRCWQNAARAVLALAHDLPVVYVEGFITTDDGDVIAHGWVETAGSVIIDPTLADGAYGYFGGLRLPAERVEELDLELLPLAWRRNPTPAVYREAFIAAALAIVDGWDMPVWAKALLCRGLAGVDLRRRGYVRLMPEDMSR